VTDAQHTVENDGYEYSVQPLQGVGGLTAAHAKFYAHFMEAFEDAQKAWEAKVVADDRLKHYDSCYLYSMVLGMDGMPAALIMNVDDIVQSFTFSTMEKIEEDPK
jgi:hypothetical protein